MGKYTFNIMNARQLISPNLNPVIVENGKTLTDWFGWCLAYVQNAFGVGWAGAYATQAWNSHAINQHTGIPPNGVWVPIYFSGYGGLGHIALYKDGLVYSSPWHHKASYDEMPSIAETTRIYNVTYVGWCEGLAGKQIVEMVADAAPIPPAPKFTVIETYNPAKQVKLNKQPTNLWGMNYAFDYMAAHPVEVHNQGEIWAIVDKVHHVDGYDYYRRDGQVDGFNVVDCDDYTPSAPILPYIPPAAPIPVVKAETYLLVTSLPYYSSVTAVQNSQAASGSLPATTYYVWEKGGVNNTYYNLTTDNTKNMNMWVNSLYNVLPKPVVAPAPATVVISAPKVETSSEVMQSFSWFDPSKEHKPVVYKIEKSIKVYDQVHTGQAILIEAGKDIEVYGTFTKDGYIYLRPLTSLDEQGMYYYYGIVTTDIYSGAPYLSKETTQGDTVYYDAELYINKAVKTLEGVFRWLKRK